MITESWLARFVQESNRIEGIADTTEAQIAAHAKFLDGALHIPALVELVGVLQPNARFRNAVNISGVRVGDHIAPPSGPDIEGNLRSILAMRDPWEQHIAYETLHPFTDGNGRSGRALWLHRYLHEPRLDPYAPGRGFLHSFYYHTLSHVRLAQSPTLQPSCISRGGWGMTSRGGQLGSGPPAYIYWQCVCGWTTAAYDPDHPNARRSAYEEWCAHSACSHGALAPPKDSPGISTPIRGA